MAWSERDTNRQRDRQTDKQTVRHSKMVTGGGMAARASRADWLSGCLAVWLAG